jgi:hypothetical protein
MACMRPGNIHAVLFRGAALVRRFCCWRRWLEVGGGDCEGFHGSDAEDGFFFWNPFIVLYKSVTIVKV